MTRPTQRAILVVLGATAFMAGMIGVTLITGDNETTDGSDITTQVVVVEGERFACFTQESSGEDEFDCEPLRTGAN